MIKIDRIKSASPKRINISTTILFNIRRSPVLAVAPKPNSGASFFLRMLVKRL